MGLVKQCLTSLYKKNIQRLTKVRKCFPVGYSRRIFFPKEDGVHIITHIAGGNS